MLQGLTGNGESQQLEFLGFLHQEIDSGPAQQHNAGGEYDDHGKMSQQQRPSERAGLIRDRIAYGHDSVVDHNGYGVVVRCINVVDLQCPLQDQTGI